MISNWKLFISNIDCYKTYLLKTVWASLFVSTSKNYSFFWNKICILFCNFPCALCVLIINTTKMKTVYTILFAIVALAFTSCSSSYTYYTHQEEDDVYFTKKTDEEVDGYQTYDVDAEGRNTYRDGRTWRNRRDRDYNNDGYSNRRNTNRSVGSRPERSKPSQKSTPSRSSRPSSRPSKSKGPY